MKSAIVALCFIGCAYAAVSTSPDALAQTVKSSNDQTPEGNFNYGYETENGISAQVAGALKQIGKEFGIEVAGSSQYKNPEGELISLTYTADENGFHPQGAHLPTPPAPEPIPDYIQRSLEYNKAHPYIEKSS